MESQKRKELSILAIVTGTTAGILIASLSVKLLTFAHLSWLILFWTKWVFAAFVSGFALTFGVFVAMGIYKSFINDPD